MTTTEFLAITSARPGMRLAMALLDERGQVLVPAGSVLSASLLDSLLRRGIGSLCVARQAADDPAAGEARRRRQREQLDRRFRLAGQSPETRTLYAALLAFLADQA